MVYIFLATGFEEAEALIPADLLRRAGLDVALVGVTGAQITGGHDITVTADCTLSQVDIRNAQLLMLPGGGVGVANLAANPDVESLIQQGAEENILLAAICAAPSLLAKYGVLGKKQAVCYPGWESKLGDATHCKGTKVVVDGNVITAQAAGASFDFALTLIEVLLGTDKMAEVRDGIYYC